MRFCRLNLVVTLVIFISISAVFPAVTRAASSPAANGGWGGDGAIGITAVPRSTQRYVCSRVRANNFDDVIMRLEKKSLDIVDVYFTISCGSDTADSTMLEIAVSMSNKEFVTDFIDYLKDRDEWDKTHYTDMTLNHMDANGESLLDYLVRLKNNARDDSNNSPREAVQWYIDYLKENGAKHAIELVERSGNYISPVIFPPVAPE